MDGRAFSEIFSENYKIIIDVLTKIMNSELLLNSVKKKLACFLKLFLQTRSLVNDLRTTPKYSVCK